jgi:hypothetical protein
MSHTIGRLGPREVALLAPDIDPGGPSAWTSS